MEHWRHSIRESQLISQQVPHRMTMDDQLPMTDPNGAAIYGVPWIPSIYPSHVSIYTSTMDPMGKELEQDPS